MALPEAAKIQLLSPVLKGRKGRHEKVLEQAKKSGYVRVRADGSQYDLSEEIAKIANALMRNKYRVDSVGRKFYEQDNKLLTTIKNTLFAELAMSLNTTFEEINEKIITLIAISEK